MRRRRRPKAPSFYGAPPPKHRSREAEHVAKYVMAYFEPWALRADDADDAVSYAGLLRETKRTWAESLSAWLEEGVLCEESQRYVVSNFMAVHRLRPVDGEDEPHSDDIGDEDDEELEVSHEQLVEALETRIGGREKKPDAGHNDSTEDAGHRANSAAGIANAQAIWKAENGNDQASTAH